MIFSVLTRLLPQHQARFLKRQEAQLSQSGRAMRRDFEHFAKSLKIIQGHWK